MKAIKGGVLFGILVLVMGSCFDPPEFPTTPAIDFANICFKPGGIDADSLIVTLTFKDGNGDLGLSPTADIDEPYHENNLFVVSNGQLVPIGRKRLYSNIIEQFLDVPDGLKGELARARTHRDPAYSSLVPEYISDAESCSYYKYDSVFISEEDLGVIDTATTNVVYVGRSDVNPDYVVLVDTFYYQKNPRYSNIEVEFWVKEGGEFVEYDWLKATCVDFNGRFPLLSEKEGPLEGNLKYRMISSGIRNTFSIKTMKLRIKIRDRDFNESNVVETPEFTLDKITCK